MLCWKSILFVISVDEEWQLKEVYRIGAKNHYERMLLIYFTCAERWRWTPDMVDKVKSRLLKQLLVLAKIKEEERERIGRISS